jgi:hypothetical protein
MTMRNPSLARALALTVTLFAGGCSSDDDPAGEADTGLLDTETGEDTATGDASLDASDEADTDSASADTDTAEPDVPVDPCTLCPSGWACLDESCVECVGNEQCTYPAWCKDNACVETECVPDGVGKCEDNVPHSCAADGGSWIAGQACAEGEACVQGQCDEIVCDALSKTCDKLQILQCNESGTGFGYVPCPPGTACFGETCTAIKPNLVLVFDTSGSMGSIGFLDTVPCICGAGNCKAQPYPACEDIQCPQSKLGLAKKVLHDLFESPAFGGVRFAMTRFPQRIKANASDSCTNLFGVGHYQTLSDKITGDDDAHVPPEGGWFEENLNEILCVGFPKTLDEDTKAKGLAWVDGDEQFETTGVPCEKNFECFPDVCAWDSQTQTGECAGHTNPELRATGNTPLGKSLFYAGEYIRKFIVAEGKACEVDADCENVNYFCGPDGACFDPLRECRENIIILFTDGEETENIEMNDFFNPVLQAKRLHYGLGCAFDSDCLDGAKCKNNVCQDYPMPNTGFPEVIGYINGAGANKLTDRLGNGISVRVHVVDISEGAGYQDNKRVADHGGGVFYPVKGGDPSKLLEAFESAIDIKENIKKCVPEFPESEGP